MSTKQHLSASVDAELVATAQQAVTEGHAESISARVNDALRLKADRDRRLQALDDFWLPTMPSGARSPRPRVHVELIPV